MSTLAVFIALGGSSYAALTISGASIKNRSIPAKKLKRNTITGKEVRESRLSRVPTGEDRRPARRLHRRRAQGPLPGRHVPDRRRLRGANAAAGHRPTAARCCSALRSARRRGPAGDCPRTASSGRAGGRAARAGGELTSNVYPSGTDPGRLDVLVVTDQVGGVALTPDTAAGSKAYRCVTDPLN